MVAAVVITDSPERIRQFLADHEDDPGLFGQSVLLKKERSLWSGL